MDVSKVLSDFRLLAGGVDTSQLSDANALVLANKIYREGINTIRTNVKEDYFYDEWFVDTVTDQRIYGFLPRKDNLGQAGMVKIKGVSIKYTSGATEYTKARLDTLGNLDRDLQWYIENQSNTDPFYAIESTSFSIYPAPTEAVSGGLYLYGIADPVDMVLAGTEETIKIPLEYHDIIPLGMVYLYYKSRLLTQEKNDAFNEYQVYLKKMIRELSDRNEVPLISEKPYLDHLK